MVKTYPQDHIEKELKKSMRIFYAGVVTAVIFAGVGVIQKEPKLFLCAIVVLAISVVVAFLYGCRTKPLKWCQGDVLEVKNNKVLYRHEKPFVYKETCVVDKELVPMDFGKEVSVIRTFRIAFCNKILSYTLVCTVGVIDSQKFYNMFLDSRKRYILSPEKVITTCVAAFLNNIRGRVVELYQDAAFSGERLNEHVSMTTMCDAEVYLQDELNAYGLLVREARPISSLDAIIIE